PLGIKPFFYYHTAGSLAFASEAGALVESGAAPFAPSSEAIAESLTAPYFSSVTPLPFSGIERLAPGHWLEFTAARFTVARYYHFDPRLPAAADPDTFVEETA